METAQPTYYIEAITIIGYLILMITVGAIFNRFNKNTDDYFRSGCRGTWWLVGTSAFMISFTAWTFTGAAGAAFLSGWTVLFIYAGNAAGYLLCAALIAPWFRQLRITTAPEIFELRYNEFTRQLTAYIQFFSSFFFAGLTLYGLAIFCSSVFGVNIQMVILVLGIVVIFYSVTGGSWAVLATDFLQGIILIPLTVLVTILCLKEVGGIGGFFEGIEQQGLTESYKALKTDLPATAMYSPLWAVAIFCNNILVYLNFRNAVQYAQVKTGNEARKAALLAGILTILGTLVWMIPPIVGRLLFADEILSTAISKPAEAAYAITAMKLLPAGLTGIMVVAIFSATMSNMDTGLNRNAAILVKDIYPQLWQFLGLTPCSDQRKLVISSRVITLILGFFIVGMALYYSFQEGRGIFEIMLNLMAAAGAPVVPSAFFGLLVRKVHKWAAALSIAAGWIPAAIGIFSPALFGESWSFHVRFLSTFSVASLVFLGTIFFWNTTDAEYREKVKRFFIRRDTPVKFDEEVGNSTDYRQLKILGTYCLVITAGIIILGFVPDNVGDRITTWLFASTLGLLGGLMYRIGSKPVQSVNS